MGFFTYNALGKEIKKWLFLHLQERLLLTKAGLISITPMVSSVRYGRCRSLYPHPTCPAAPKLSGGSYLRLALCCQYLLGSISVPCTTQLKSLSPLSRPWYKHLLPSAYCIQTTTFTHSSQVLPLEDMPQEYVQLLISFKCLSLMPF